MEMNTHLETEPSLQTLSKRKELKLMFFILIHGTFLIITDPFILLEMKWTCQIFLDN